MTPFNKPIKPITIEEFQKLREQLVQCYSERIKISVGTAFAKTLEQQEHFYIKRLMVDQRIASLKIKILKACDCGKSHIEDIENEERLKKQYTEQLLEACDNI